MLATTRGLLQDDGVCSQTGEFTPQKVRRIVNSVGKLLMNLIQTGVQVADGVCADGQALGARDGAAHVEGCRALSAKYLGCYPHHNCHKYG